jgi:hypothetical protein
MKRGYVDDSGYWRYSIYRNYMELEAVLPVEMISWCRGSASAPGK